MGRLGRIGGLLPLMLLVGLAGIAEIAPFSTADATDFRDASPARSPERPRFSFDAGAIWEGDSAWVAVEVAVPYRELMFRTNEKGYGATFDLIVALFDGKRQVNGDLWHERVQVPTYADTRTAGTAYQRVVQLPAYAGDLRVEVTVSEQASGNEGRLAQDVTVPDPKREGLIVGKIWFGRCPADSTGEASRLPSEPLVSRNFGTGSGPVCVWSRVYGRAAPGVPLRVSWQLYDDKRVVVAQDSLPSVTQNAEIPVSFHLPIEKLWLGGYELRLAARAGKEDATRVVDFDMDETTVSLEANPVESIALVRYIATADEIRALENAKPEDRQKAWDDFWSKRGPGFKEQFFSRVRYANEHFSSLGPGWKTDRGMIYITYGAPDQVESYPHNIDGPPYEIWSYYSYHRRFVFIDYDGFGRYELYTPGR
jgi:GWxTD domain-containing protein